MKEYGHSGITFESSNTTMDQDFIKTLYDRHVSVDPVPPNKAIAGWAKEVIGLLYPEKSANKYESAQQFEGAFGLLESQLTAILFATKACECCDIPAISTKFFSQLPQIYWLLNTDLKAIIDGDPAAHNEFEVIRAYPGFLAICFYRIAHALHELEVPLIPRILTEYVHAKTGIDIHPAAQIGAHFFIDHGTGIVIGETTIIGDHVKLYQGVTLGALSVDKKLANTKRHPTVEDHVVIYSGATILGGETIIGANSTIGGNVWLTRSVPAGSKVYHIAEIHVIEGEPHLNSK